MKKLIALTATLIALAAILCTGAFAADSDISFESPAAVRASVTSLSRSTISSYSRLRLSEINAVPEQSDSSKSLKTVALRASDTISLPKSGVSSVPSGSWNTSISGVRASYDGIGDSIDASPLSFKTSYGRVDNSAAFMYFTLNATEQMVYEEIYKAVMLSQNIIKLSGILVTGDDVGDAYYAFTMDHPECFWLDKTMVKVSRSSSANYTKVKLVYTDGSVTDDLDSGLRADRSEISRQIYSFASASAEIVSAMGSGLSESAREKFIFDYLCSSVAYDYDHYNGLAYHESSLNAYGAIVNGLAMCGGYSDAFQYLCNSVGINCTKVAGSGHIWNIAEIDGVWYHADVTWADGSAVNYFYFNATQAAMESVHPISYNRQPVIPAADTIFSF